MSDFPAIFRRASLWAVLAGLAPGIAPAASGLAVEHASPLEQEATFEHA